MCFVKKTFVSLCDIQKILSAFIGVVLAISKINHLIFSITKNESFIGVLPLNQAWVSNNIMTPIQCFCLNSCVKMIFCFNPNSCCCCWVGVVDRTFIGVKYRKKTYTKLTQHLKIFQLSITKKKLLTQNLHKLNTTKHHKLKT